MTKLTSAAEKVLGAINDIHREGKTVSTSKLELLTGFNQGVVSHCMKELQRKRFILFRPGDYSTVSVTQRLMVVDAEADRRERHANGPGLAKAVPRPAFDRAQLEAIRQSYEAKLAALDVLLADA